MSRERHSDDMHLICISGRFCLLTHPYSQHPILHIVRTNLVIHHLSMAPPYLQNENKHPELGLKLQFVSAQSSLLPLHPELISAKPPAVSKWYRVSQGSMPIPSLEVSLATFILANILHLSRLLSRLKSICIISRNLVLTCFPK